MIDYSYLEDHKLSGNGYYDIVIEVENHIIDSRGEILDESTFVCLVNIVKNNNDYKPKLESQKIKVKGVWFEIYSVYGMLEDKNNNECEICCSKDKNIVFLPCKHSYCCDICAITIRQRGNWCPICRNSKCQYIIYILISYIRFTTDRK